MVALLLMCSVLVVRAEPKTQARLLLSADTAKAGTTILVGIELQTPINWHTYWRNAGDSGQATHVRWNLPAGITAGSLLWPVPEKLVTPPITTYVYSDRVVILASLQISPAVAPGLQAVTATVSWLECGTICLPASATVGARFQVGPESKPSRYESLLAVWQKRLPKVSPSQEIQARWDQPSGKDVRGLVVDPGPDVAVVDFYPYEAENYEIAGETGTISTNGATWLRKKVTRLSGDWPAEIRGLIVLNPTKADSAPALEVNLKPALWPVTLSK